MNAAPRARKTTPWISLLLVTATGGGLWWYGADYYLTPLADRRDHALHELLAPTGTIGHPLGWAGIAMMVLLLGYSLRKRVRWLQGLGALGNWLSVHVFLGLMGPLLITFHSGFRVGGIVAIAYWSMMITMLSGVFGRYIYVQIPSSVIGTRQSLAALGEESRQLAAELRELLGPAAERFLQEDAWDRRQRGWRAVAGLVVADVKRPLERWRLVRDLRGQTDLPRPLEPGEIYRITGWVQQRRLVERRAAAAEAMEAVFHYWHVLHRPFVYITFLIAAVHIGVAVWLGYTGW